MIFKRRTKHYLILTPTETSLALRALLHFRNKAISREIDPVDIDLLMLEPGRNSQYGLN